MKASFVIPSYNSSFWVPHAIKSCQKQTYPDIEIVVIDDCSTDSTQEKVLRLAGNDTRINYVRLPKNVGRSEARNTGNRIAKGDVILVLDADDIAYPERAALTVKALKNADFCHGSADVIDAIGSNLGTFYADVFNKDKAIKEGVNRIVHSSVGYTKDLALRFPYPDGEAARLGVDDWSQQLSISFSGAKMAHITQVVGAYRDIGTGISKTRNQDEVAAFKKAFTEDLAQLA